MNQKLARAVLLQGAKDVAPSWANTQDAKDWCKAAGISIQDYRDALHHLAQAPEAQHKLLLDRLRRRLA